ncbi:MAG: leucine-rich repeat domain-containing protein [Promethearchaeota archaeon]
MSDKLFLVVRSAKAPAKNYHFIFKTHADEGSAFFERKSNLKWIEEIDQPVRIDISSNWLTEVDLSPLGSCKDLEYLSLAVNKLESIDLTPLQNLKQLRHLDLSHNRLKSIDLTPLAGCENLVYLYLQENMFPEVNIAPLFGLNHLTTAVIQLVRRGTRPKIIMDSYMSNVPPNLNDILFSFFTGRRAGFVPDWLYDKNTEIEYSPKCYSELVAEFGWAAVKKHLVTLSKKLKIGVEFTAQKILLDAFGIPELACYDGRVRDIVKFLPTRGSYEEGVRKLYSEMVNLLETQLKRRGSTLYFDTDTLSTTPGSVLLPTVLARRNAEMHEVVLYNRSGEIDLFPLWLTSYGYKILKALGLKRYAAESQICEINKALKDINHELSIEKVVYDERENKTQELSISHAIQSHVRKTVAT